MSDPSARDAASPPPPLPSATRQIVLSSRPSSVPLPSNFSLVESPIRPLSAMEILVEILFVAAEPAMRGWVNSDPGYSPPIAIGAVMRSFAVGRIIYSLDPHYSVGEYCTGEFGWQEHAIVKAEQIDRRLPAPCAGNPALSAHLGVLGLNGLTAYIGLVKLGHPKPGHTVVVSAGAGSVGSCVGQIARILGCRTVAIVGSNAKADYCRQQFKYDAAVNYHDDNWEQQLKDACPNGVNIYFDNTGSFISDAVYPLMSLRGEVIICGTIATQCWRPVPTGPRLERNILIKRLSVQGFIVLDHRDYYDEALSHLSQWLGQGLLAYREERLSGLDQCMGAVERLYKGENQGKVIIQLKEINEEIEAEKK